MATVVLQVVGAAIGGAVGGPVGATIGRAVGAAAGYAIDQKLFSKDQVVKGGRLDGSSFLTSVEGAPLPRVYGRVKTGGQLIWATRFEEQRKRKKRGGKGGPKVTSETYRYFANFAVGICHGPVSRIGRIWADGKELDQTRFTIRLYHGDESQLPDPLIEALQSAERTPAYRDTAYAVFEDFPLADYGNRVPQITFEVIRSIAAVDRQIRAVTIIPGSTEFGYAPQEIRTGKKGRKVSQNRHALTAQSDWSASLDELQALCPNLERVSLVVAWFGTDLRAGHCSIEPRCTYRDADEERWQVSGVNRNTANLVTIENGSSAYGGTPSDQSVLDAIADLKARGLKVSLYPFIMMDIPGDNDLPSPYLGTGQPEYPWRGRITCDPAIGVSGSADKTASAGQQVANFLGNAEVNDFGSASGLPVFNGAGEFSYRRMILHYANLCMMAGGVERFFIGSEMRELTTVRDNTGDFPFVDGLVTLAGDVKQILPVAEISYAADWSEYFGYHPADGSNDVYFHLDPLWASGDIDAVSIDNYMPLADWSVVGDVGSNDTPSRHDLDYLKANITGGEGSDWYYANLQDRLSSTRTPITDGQGEEWIWAYKRLKDWWSNPHHERINGQRLAQPSPWVSESKPIWFSEAGCPAVDRGVNQPNVFLDPKSTESNLPYHSRGGRDDLGMLRYHQAMLEFWSGGNASHNPVSTSYGGRMISADDIYAWCWDARPFPIFPQRSDVWSDGQNWYRGHWLNGRLGTCPLDDLISAIVADHGFETPLAKVDGHLDGYILAGETTPRQALEPLMAAFNLTASSHDEQLAFLDKNHSRRIQIKVDDLVQEEENPKLSRLTQGESELARQVALSHGEIDNGYEVTTTVSRRLETASGRQQTIELPAVVSHQTASALTNARLLDHWGGRETIRFSLPHRYLRIEAGDILSVEEVPDCRIHSVATGTERQLEGMVVRHFDEAVPWVDPKSSDPGAVHLTGEPLVLAMNLPLRQNELDPAPALYFAATANPWPGPLAVYGAEDGQSYREFTRIEEPAQIFELVEPLASGPIGRWDKANSILIRMIGESQALASLNAASVLAGENVLVLQNPHGGSELVQFAEAALVAADTWRLSVLLRGQLGTSTEMPSGFPTGTLGAVLDGSSTTVEIPRTSVGREFQWRVGPVSESYTSDEYDELSATCLHLSKRPMPPVHLRAIRMTDYVDLFWIRQTRLGGDDWSGLDVPLDFATERYRLEIMDGAGQLQRTVELSASSFQYADADRLSDLGSLQVPYTVTVAQLDDRGVAGPPMTLHSNP